MGSSSSKLSSSVTDLMKCWKDRKGKLGGLEAYDGGYFGGDFTDEKAEKAMEEIAEYRSSLSAKFKQDVVQGIAQALKQLGVEIDPGASMKEIAEVIKTRIPHPTVNGQAFVVNDKSQKELCKLIANHLNSVFTPGAEGSNRLIDLREGPAAICRAVFELTQALATGAQTEFLKIQAQVRKALRNIEIFDLVMQKMYAKLIEKVKQSADEKNASVIERAGEVYKKADELRRMQFEILKGLLDTTLGPAEKELLTAMRKFDVSRDKIETLLGEDLEKIGTQDFSSGISEVLQSLGIYAYIADLVDKSLKQTGINLAQYADSKDMKEFEKIVDDKEKSRTTMKGLDDFVNAVNVLKSQFKNRDRIQKIIQGESGDPADASDIVGLGEDDGCACGSVEGGADIDPKTVLEKQIDTERQQRVLIVKRFVEVTNDIYSKLLKDINAMAPKIGKEIPITDKLRDLRDAMLDIQDIELIKISIALIGLGDKADQRTARDNFNSRIKTLIEVLDEIMSLKAYDRSLSLFAAIREDIKQLLDTIGHYADIVKSKYGGAEEGNTYDASVLHKSSYDLKTAINTFKYHFYIADVYENLDAMKGEFAGYSDKYGEILGEAVAAKLKDITAKNDRIIKELKAIEELKVITKKSLDHLRAKLNEEFETKKKFYYALQAIDIYLKEFAKSVAAHPKDILEVRKMLEGIQIIARWYNDESGNALVEAFEQFRGMNAAHTDLVDNPNADIDLSDKKHYYTKIDNTQLGIPFVPLDLRTDDGIKKSNTLKANISKTVDNFQALKNVLNAFARIGDKFGGVELYRQTSMGPSKIYEALRDFLKYSSVSHGLNIDKIDSTKNTMAALPGAPPLPQLNIGAGAGAAFPPPVAGLLPTADANFAYVFNEYMSSIKQPVNTENFESIGGNFKEEHTFFWHMMKAIAAKIMTVLNVYDLLNKPAKIDKNAFDTRTIIGGAVYQPKIIPEATELYFRIPRLYEFYKKFFDMKTKRQDGGDGKDIFYIGGLDGKFAKLARLIIDSPVTDGTYTDYDAYEIIGEINALYTQFAEEFDKEIVVKKMVEAIIKDVNQRYGYLKKAEFKKYMDELNATGPTVDHNPHETNYAILPDEGDYAPAMSGPSDRYDLPGKTTENRLSDKYGIGSDPRDKLIAFRDRFEKMFADEPSEEFKSNLLDISYHDVIAQTKKDIDTEQDEDKRRKIALKLIQSSNTMLKGDRLNYMMFHETVVTSVTMLKAIKKVFETYRKMVILTDVKGFTDDAVKKFMADQNLYETDPAPDGLIPQAAAGDTRHILARILNEFITTNDGENIIGPAVIDEFLNDTTAAGPLDCTDGRGGYLGTFALNTLIVALPVWAGAAPAANTEEYLRIYLWFAMNYQKMMKYMLTTLLQMSLDLDDMFKVEFTDSQKHPIHINSTGLENMVDNLLNNAKDYLNKFRRIINKNVIKQYEGVLKGLEETLVDVFIRPQKSLRGVTIENTDKHTLNQLEMRLNRAFNMLIGAHAHDPSATFGPAGNALVAPNEGVMDNRKEHYAQVLASLIFYDANDGNNSGVIDNAAPVPLIGVAGGNTIDSPLARFKEIFQNRTPLNNNPLVNPAQLRMNDIFGVNWTHGDRAHSMLMNFNRFIVNYLRVFTSDTEIKIYTKLVDTFVNGAFSEQILTLTKTFPDILDRSGGVAFANADARFGARGDPKPDNLLFTSIAILLQNIMLTKINATKPNKMFATDSMAEIPLYMRERYRMGLPVFKKLFSMLIKEGNFLSQLANKTAIDLKRTQARFVNAVDGANMYNGNANYTNALGVGGNRGIYVANLLDNRGAVGRFAYVTNANANNGQNLLYRWGDQLHYLVPTVMDELNHSVLKDRFTEIINRLISGSTTMIGCIDSVVAELGDSPKFCEVGDNSIELFKSLNGKLPLMPPSLTQIYLRDIQANVSDMFPDETIVTPAFKFLYGVRKLLNDQKSKSCDFKDMPWLKYAVDLFQTQPKKAKITDADLMRYMNVLIGGMRYFTSLRNYGGIFRPVGAVPAYAGFTNLVNATDPTISYPLHAKGARREMDRIIEVVENSTPDDKIDDIVKIFDVDDNTHGEREYEIRANIIDLNVVPINVHALMRSIPLAPTYNYAYSFEKMVCAMFRKIRGDVTSRGNGAGNAFKDTREMFLRLLIDPGYSPEPGFIGSHTRINGANGLMYRLMRGNDALGLGRPKYISDQIFNKALLGNIYPYGQSLDESGVGASQALHMSHMVESDGSGLGQATIMNRQYAFNRVNITRKQMVKYVSDIINGLRNGSVKVQAGQLVDLPAKPSNLTDDMYTRINAWFGAGGVAISSAVNTAPVARLNLGLPAVPLNAGGRLVFTRNGANDIINFATSAVNMADLPIDWTLAELSRYTNHASKPAGTPLTTLLDVLEYMISGNFGAMMAKRVADSNFRGIGLYTWTNDPLGLTPMDTLESLGESVSDQALRLTYLDKEPNTGPDYAPRYDSSDPRSYVYYSDRVFSIPERTNLDIIGAYRMNTHLVRNLMLITNIWRVLRAELDRKATEFKTVLVKDEQIINPDLAEFNDTIEERQFKYLMDEDI